MSAAVGNKLRLARAALELTLEQATAETHIGLHYLRAMESGNFDALPSRVQMRGFLRTYADYLHLDAIPLFEALEKDALMALMPPEADVPEDESKKVDSPVISKPMQEVDTNFIKVGEMLKNQRELLGLSLDDVARHTHLRLHYLQALERGDMDDLPSAVQGTGMLKNYAEFLSLDPEPMLLRYAEKLQAQLGARKAEQKQNNVTEQRPKRAPVKPLTPVRRFFSREMLIGGMIVFTVITIVLWAGLKISAARNLPETPQPTAPSIADVLLPSNTPSVEPSVTATVPSLIDVAAETVVGSNAGANNLADPVNEIIEGAVQVQVSVRRRAFVRVIVDGEVAFNARLAPGSIQTFAGQKSIEVLSGDAAALQVSYNGVELGVLGGDNEVVNFILAPDGLITPTPTISPTPTRTPRVTRTPRGTQSP